MAEFLGQGWQFPIRVNGRGGLNWSSGDQAVREAIWVILSTPKRSQIMEPEFGCGIHDYVFAPATPTNRAAIEAEVRRALVRWEARIDVLRVDAVTQADEPNVLLIEVEYRLRVNNAARNIVYPFYINEGPA